MSPDKERQERKMNNIDITGRKWKLAPGGRDLIDKCQTSFCKTQSELFALGALFRNMEGCDLSSEEIWGLGVLLERMGRRVGSTSEKLTKSVTDKTTP